MALETVNLNIQSSGDQHQQRYLRRRQDTRRCNAPMEASILDLWGEKPRAEDLNKGTYINVRQEDF